jgi:hypothetical protein
MGRSRLRLYRWHYLWFQLLRGRTGLHQRELCHAAPGLPSGSGVERFGLCLHRWRNLRLQLLRGGAGVH